MAGVGDGLDPHAPSIDPSPLVVTEFIVPRHAVPELAPIPERVEFREAAKPIIAAIEEWGLNGSTPPATKVPIECTAAELMRFHEAYKNVTESVS